MRESIKYKTLTAIRYLGDGFFYPFFALYLVSRNLTEAKIGFILSISPLLAIILNPIYSRICNTLKKTKITLGVISILEGAMILLIGLSSNFYLITALTILMALFGSCHYGLMDSLLAIYADSSKQPYSSIRIFGSLSYIVATASAGYICKLINYQFAFAISFILFAGSGVMYLLLKDIEVQKKEEETKKGIKEYLHLLKNKEYVCFMIFYGLMFALIFTTNYFFSTYLETRGVTSDQYGLVYSYFVAVEVILLLILTHTKKKISPYLLLVIVSISLALRMVVCYLDAPVWLVIVMSGFRGVCFALMLHVSYQFIVDLVGEEHGTLGIMLATLAYSVSLFIINNVTGRIIEDYGYTKYHLICLIAAGVMILYSSLLPIINKKEKIIEE